MPSPTSLPVADPSIARWDRAFFGHPRGLSTLFFTEMWERFSYYGMRALLILFMVAPANKGGLGFSTSKAGAIYGFYTAMVYLMNLPGGWIADRITGARTAVLWGGIVIAFGHFSMAIPSLTTFYLGLALIVVGTGLLKPNVSTMVGSLYTKQDARRDGGFSIFYMGINIGAMLSPLVCGYLVYLCDPATIHAPGAVLAPLVCPYLGENINWHYGFGAAGVGMTLGLIQYTLGGKYLGKAGLSTNGSLADRLLFRRWLMIGVALLVAAGIATEMGWINISAETLSDAFGVALLIIVIVFFTWLMRSQGFTPQERGRLWAIIVLFVAAAAFWSAFEQSGSTLNLFAERNTNLHAWDFPLWGLFRASYFQSFNSMYIILLAPAFAWLWVALKNHEPSSTAKFSWGLVFVALSFAILIPVANGTSVSPWWLTIVYLLQTIGELCLSPVGLSAMTKLAPPKIAGMVMGVWFLATSVGDYIGGRLASFYESFPIPLLFTLVAGFCMVIGILLIFLLRPMKRLMGGVN